MSPRHTPRHEQLPLFGGAAHVDKLPKPPAAELRGVNPYIKQYAGQLGAGSVISTLPDGRNVRLADPVEHGYVIDDIPPNIVLGQE